MKKFFHCLEYLFQLNFKLDNILRRLDNMATKDDVLASVAQLGDVIANETAEIQLVIEQKTKAAVSEAVAPLLKQIQDLTDELAQGAHPGTGVVFTQEQVDDIQAKLQAALEAIKNEVTPEPETPAQPPADSTTPETPSNSGDSSAPASGDSTPPADTPPVVDGSGNTVVQPTA